MPGSEQPCLQLGVAIVDSEGRPFSLSAKDLKAQVQSGIEISEDDVRINRFIVAVEGMDTTKDVPYKRYTILLVDHSYSMFDSYTEDGIRKFDAAMKACEEFATDFRDGDNVAIIPFSSHEVSDTVMSVPFVSYKTEVMNQISCCGAVATMGNTGLYTAMAAALERMSRQKIETEKEYGVEPRCLLVVLTDGENYVNHEKDDKGLFEEWGIVKDIENRVQIQVITIGFGKPEEFNEKVLKKLAWPDESSYRKTSYGSDLIEAFVAARKFLLNGIHILFLPNEEYRSQFITQKSIRLRLYVGDPKVVIESTFRFPETPPGRIAPPFEQDIRPEERALFEQKSRSPSESFLFQYCSVFLLSSILFVLLWFVLPRRLWKKDYEVSVISKDIGPLIDRLRKER